ncbi:MAG: hypothetical protein VX910_01840 [Candidatus Latescibacterota bacterium]|nr:hypothetical protein [Candidatus Latescibacterota bacterium]
MKKFLYLLLASALWSPSADATTSSGRLTTALYSFDRAFQDTATSGSLRAYQTGRFKFLGLASRSELSFQAYGRVSDDFQGDVASDPAYRLYHAYLKWHDRRKRFRIALGRQTVFAGVAVGRIDGLRLRFSPFERLQIDAFGGALISGGGEGFRHPNAASLIGSHLVFSDLGGVTLGVSFLRRSRRINPYLSSARLDAGLPSSEIRPGEVEQQMFGVDMSRRFGMANAIIRWDVSTPQSLKTRRFEGVLRFSQRGWTISGTFLYRTPYIDQNSLFAVFTQSSNQEVSFRANQRFSRHLGIFSEVTRLAYDRDSGYRVNIGFNLLNGYIGYSRRTGFGGSADGLNGVIRYRFSRTLMTSFSIGMSTFRTYSGTDVRSLVLANTIGLVYRPHRKLSLNLQGQRLKQDLEGTASGPFTGAGNDLRLFFSVSTWFFHKGKG